VTVTAIIASAGRGRRMASDVAKQFLELHGAPILVHTLKKFDKNPDVDNIILVAPANAVDFLKMELVEKFRISKVSKIVVGGNSRQQSVWNGLKNMPLETTLVAIHDGVRPFVTSEEISRVIAAAEEEGAAVLAVPVKDTVKIVRSGKIESTPDRERIWLAQTPQVFRKEIIIDAYRLAMEKKFSGTDDASLVEKLGVSVSIVEGSYSNIKITTPEDLDFAEIILQKMR